MGMLTRCTDGAALLDAGYHHESMKSRGRKRGDALKAGNWTVEGWRVRAKPETSMTMNTESECRFETQVQFWVLVLANASMIALSMLGLALYYHIVRLLN